MRCAVRPVAAAVLLGALAALTSCISVESHFTFKADGSGEFRLVYRVAPPLTALGGSVGMPLPITEGEFRTAAAAVDGVELINYRSQEREDEVEISATLGFDRVERLAELSGLANLEARLQGGGRGRASATFEQLIAAAGDTPVLDAESLELLRSLLAEHAVKFVVRAPRPIRGHSDGTLSGDGRAVELTIPLATYLMLSERRTLTVEW